MASRASRRATKNCSSVDATPAKFAGRTFYQHNPQVTLMRTTPEECAELGRILAEKVNLSTAPVSVLLPTKAISVISAPGQKFHDPVADRSLFTAMRTFLRKDIELVEMDCVINDPPDHGRIESRKIWTTTELNDYLDFPHVGQVFAIEVKSGRKKSARGLTAFCARQPKAVPIIVTPENFAAFSRDPRSFLVQAGGLST